MMKIRIEVDSACPKEEIVFRCSSLSEEILSFAVLDPLFRNGRQRATGTYG